MTEAQHEEAHRLADSFLKEYKDGGGHSLKRALVRYVARQLKTNPDPNSPVTRRVMHLVRTEWNIQSPSKKQRPQLVNSKSKRKKERSLKLNI